MLGSSPLAFITIINTAKSNDDLKECETVDFQPFSADGWNGIDLGCIKTNPEENILKTNGYQNGLTRKEIKIQNLIRRIRRSRMYPCLSDKSLSKLISNLLAEKELDEVTAMFFGPQTQYQGYRKQKQPKKQRLSKRQRNDQQVHGYRR